jgi:hypothetical protein
MGIMSSRRSAAGGFGVAAFACAAALVLAGQAGAATAMYPAGGSGFGSGADGWVGSDASCGPVNPLTLLCSASNVHNAAIGNPPGSIATQVNVTLNLAGLWTGTGAWTSPPFKPDASGDSASFAFDRRVDPEGGTVDLTPTSVVTVALVDETAATTRAGTA